MRNNYNFAVFILTHGRPSNVKTIRTLKDQGYTGKIVLILDDMDKTINDYKLNYPDESFYIFSKNKAIDLTESGDNARNPRAVVYARNMTHEIAENLNLDYFLVLDDDYSSFNFKSDHNHNYIGNVKVKNLDNIFKVFIEFLININCVSIAFSQGGDYIGGYDGGFGQKITLRRKCMNSFFCATKRKFEFYGLINEDVNTYVLDGSRGKLFFTSTQLSLEQESTQQNDGGLTDIYLELGTYVKSFYSVIYNPSSVTIRDMGNSYKRLHHFIKSDNCYPKILSETVKVK